MPQNNGQLSPEQIAAELKVIAKIRAEREQAERDLAKQRASEPQNMVPVSPLSQTEALQQERDFAALRVRQDEVDAETKKYEAAKAAKGQSTPPTELETSRKAAAQRAEKDKSKPINISPARLEEIKQRARAEQIIKSRSAPNSPNDPQPKQKATSKSAPVSPTGKRS